MRELEDKVSQLHALEGHRLPSDTTTGAINQGLKKENKGGGGGVAAARGLESGFFIMSEQHLDKNSPKPK